jgi:osmotically-inducible protein OsmY
MQALLTAARIEDLQVEEAIRLALAHHVQVPGDRITVAVTDGVATLGGTVDWPYQRSAAVSATRTVPGVRHVVDRIEVAAG